MRRCRIIERTIEARIFENGASLEANDCETGASLYFSLWHSGCRFSPSTMLTVLEEGKMRRVVLVMLFLVLMM